jgi:hypothetical protein
MSDLLIRNISDSIKADLAEIADRKGKSISETSKWALVYGIDVLKKLDAEEAAVPMGKRLQQIFADVFKTDEEAEEFKRILEEVRHGPERPLPDFK